mmetsp:Transcript_15390/g.24158  ORF Transcript_15390/g.24158 Transcript_15390/m.24158 type:complete len:153 (+) Transcript_15390:335-793(+)
MLDNGKPYHMASGDIAAVADCFRYFAGLTDKYSGRTLHTPDANTTGYTKKEPIGVIGLISPWNFPLLMATWKLAPCLAAGNTCVHKISELTPLTSLFLANLINKAGIPKGVVNMVPGYGKIAGETLIKSRDVLKVSFTGSTAIGRRVMEASS